MKKYLIVSFIMLVCTTVMSKDDNIPPTIYEYPNCITQFKRMPPVYSPGCIVNTGIEYMVTRSAPTGEIKPLFGCGIDSSMIGTTIKFPIGYSQGIVIDTIVYIMTGNYGSNSVTPKIFLWTGYKCYRNSNNYLSVCCYFSFITY